MELTVWISIVTGLAGVMVASAATSLGIKIPTFLISVLEMGWPFSLLAFLSVILFALFPITRKFKYFNMFTRKE